MTDFRAAPHAFLQAAMAVPVADLVALCDAALTRDAVFDVSWPVETLRGPVAIREGLIMPLRNALTRCRRRDELFLGGANRRDTGGNWCASVTHYVGTFAAPLYDLRPSGHLAFLRAGEFYRVEADGRISHGRIILDLIDLMRQAGRSPLPHATGSEMTWPGPATHDGVLPVSQGGSASADIVDHMIDGLHAYDPETFESADQTGETGTWHPRMFWWGPGGIGSNYLWEGFVQDHRAPFLRAFPDRKGGNHYARIGDGPYAALSGWPSMTMTHRGAYMGQPATGMAMTLRVMDFYRIEDRRLIENWVLLDYMHLAHQWGCDLIAESNALERL